MKTKNLITIILALSAVVAKGGEPGISELDRLSLEIAEKSAAVQTIALTGRSDIETRKSENRLPDPSIEFEPLWTQGAAKYTASISQDFELPAAYRSRSKAIDASLRVLDRLQESTLADKALEAKLLIIEYVYQTRRMGALQAMKANLDSIAERIEKGYQGGEMTILDLRKVKIRQAELSRDISATAAIIYETVGQLNGIANGDGASENLEPRLARLKDYPESLLMPKDYYMDMALTHNPTLQLQKANSVLARELGNVASAEALPTFGLGYVFNREEGKTFNGLRFSMSVPLWRGSASKTAARLQMRNAELEETSTMTAERAAIESLYRAAETEQRSLAEQSAALGAQSGAGSWLSILRKALEAGRISMLEYLNEASYFLTASLDMEDTRRDLAVTMAKLNKYKILTASE